MNWIKNNKKLNLTVCIGLLLIMSALIIWLYSIIELKSNEIMLTTQNLSIEEVWQYEGALQWWKNVYVTAIIPATVILTLSGTITILSQKLFNRFTQKDTFSKLEKNIKQACDITPD